MKAQDSPFEALDKLLVSPPAVQNKPGKQDRRKQGNTETRKQPRKLPRKQETFPASRGVSQAKLASVASHINIEPDPPQKQRLYRKQTFELSQDDLNFLDEVKFQLRGLGITKNEVIRTGLELLAKDYRENKEASFLVRKFAGHPVSTKLP